MEQDEINGDQFGLKKDWLKLSEGIVHKTYAQRKEAIIEKSDIIKLINYRTQEETALHIEPFEEEPRFFYDIEVYEKYIIQISEEEVSFYFIDNKSILYPSYSEYTFIRGKFLSENKEKYIVLLSGSNSETEKSIIEKYYIVDKL